MKVPRDLRPGDFLLYSPSDIIGWVIAVKTWSLFSHVEGYLGEGKVLGARIHGVNIYQERIDKYLRYVRRPTLPAGRQFDLTGAWHAVHKLIGQPYEITGLFHFFNPWAHHRRVHRICSSVITQWLRGGGCKIFNPKVSADDISPAQLWQSPAAETIWQR